MNQPLLVEVEENIVLLVRLKSVGGKAVNGLSDRYDDTYPKALMSIVPEHDFNIAMRAINQTAVDFMPCVFCRFCGFLWSVFTLGLLFCCFEPCTTEMETNMRRILVRINERDLFINKGVHWDLKKKDFESWIEISQAQYHQVC